jgi:hypothetical protein
MRVTSSTNYKSAIKFYLAILFLFETPHADTAKPSGFQSSSDGASESELDPSHVSSATYKTGMSPEMYQHSRAANLVDPVVNSMVTAVSVESGAPLAVLPCPVEVPRTMAVHVDVAWILAGSGLVRRASDNNQQGKRQRYWIDPNNSTLFITVQYSASSVNVGTCQGSIQQQICIFLKLQLCFQVHKPVNKVRCQMRNFVVGIPP